MRTWGTHNIARMGASVTTRSCCYARSSFPQLFCAASATQADRLARVLERGITFRNILYNMAKGVPKTLRYRRWVERDKMGFQDGLFMTFTTSSSPLYWDGGHGLFHQACAPLLFFFLSNPIHTSKAHDYIHSTTDDLLPVWGKQIDIRHLPQPLFCLNTNSLVFFPPLTCQNSNTDRFPHLVTDRRHRR